MNESDLWDGLCMALGLLAGGVNDREGSRSSSSSFFPCQGRHLAGSGRSYMGVVPQRLFFYYVRAWCIYMPCQGM